MDRSPRAPFRLTEAELHQWFESATKPPDRASTMYRLLNTAGRPIKARNLLALCQEFRRAWQDHRHLLRPLAAYDAPTGRDDAQLNNRERAGEGSSSRPAGAPTGLGSSFSLPAGVEAGDPPAGIEEIEWSFTRFPDGRVIVGVPE